MAMILLAARPSRSAALLVCVCSSYRLSLVYTLGLMSSTAGQIFRSCISARCARVCTARSRHACMRTGRTTYYVMAVCRHLDYERTC
jgi:hypothetical protein